MLLRPRSYAFCRCYLRSVLFLAIPQIAPWIPYATKVVLPASASQAKMATAAVCNGTKRRQIFLNAVPGTPKMFRSTMYCKTETLNFEHDFIVFVGVELRLS